MRGWFHQNTDQFTYATLDLRGKGHEVYNPAEHRSTDRVYDLAAGLQYLLDHADALVALPFWRESPGASLMVANAWQLGLPVLEWPNLDTVDVCSVGIPRETTEHRILALAGAARAGKDTIGGFLVEDGWHRIAFADTLRLMLEKLNPLVTRPER